MNHHDNKKEIFSKIILKHLKALYRYAICLCKNRFDAEDLVSETVLKAFENFLKLKDVSKAKQWLFRILHNQFISHCRSRKKIVALEDQEGDNGHLNGMESFSLFEAIAKSDFVAEGDPEKDFIRKLTQAQIEKAIQELPEEFRGTLILCDMESFSYAEISAILNVPIGTVRSRIARARMILQKKLWLLAHEYGIRKTHTGKIKKEYTCTCGKEENNIEQTALTLL